MPKSGRFGPLPRDPDEVITQADVDRALDNLYQEVRKVSTTTEIEDDKSVRISDDGDYLTVQMSPVKDHPLDQIRLGKPIRIKTIFHSVQVDFEDDFGGKVSAKYEIIKAVDELTTFLKTSFPGYSKEEMERLAAESDQTYDEARRRLIEFTAHQIFEGRIALAKFLHKEFEEALKILVADLITDAQFFAMSLFGYKIVDGPDFVKKLPRLYEKRRKERANIVPPKGRPPGKSLSQEEFDDMVQKIRGIVHELRQKNKKITKSGVARKLYTGHSNPSQQLNRFFKRYDFITFEEMVKGFDATTDNLKRV